MKAIVLYQPWASLMACGMKCNETRSWPTGHRGELAIVAGKRKMDSWGLTLVTEKFKALGLPGPSHFSLIPYGVVVCVVKLYAFVPTENIMEKVRLPRFTAQELEFGDYSPGRYAWLTEGCRRLVTPVPVVGRQGLFNLTAEQERLVRLSMDGKCLECGELMFGNHSEDCDGVVI